MAAASVVVSSPAAMSRSRRTGAWNPSSPFTSSVLGPSWARTSLKASFAGVSSTSPATRMGAVRGSLAGGRRLVRSATSRQRSGGSAASSSSLPLSSDASPVRMPKPWNWRRAWWPPPPWTRSRKRLAGLPAAASPASASISTGASAALPVSVASNRRKSASRRTKPARSSTRTRAGAPGAPSRSTIPSRIWIEARRSRPGTTRALRTAAARAVGAVLCGSARCGRMARTRRTSSRPARSESGATSSSSRSAWRRTGSGSRRASAISIRPSVIRGRGKKLTPSRPRTASLLPAVSSTTRRSSVCTTSPAMIRGTATSTTRTAAANATSATTMGSQAGALASGTAARNSAAGSDKFL